MNFLFLLFRALPVYQTLLFVTLEATVLLKATNNPIVFVRIFYP
jgi:hypothetical protein